MNLTELASEIESLRADLRRYGPFHAPIVDRQLTDLLRTHAAQIAAALRLLERAKSLLPREAAKAELAVLQWHDDYRALAGGEG